MDARVVQGAVQLDKSLADEQQLTAQVYQNSWAWGGWNWGRGDGVDPHAVLVRWQRCWASRAALGVAAHRATKGPLARGVAVHCAATGFGDGEKRSFRGCRGRATRIYFNGYLAFDGSMVNRAML